MRQQGPLNQVHHDWALEAAISISIRGWSAPPTPTHTPAHSMSSGRRRAWSRPRSVQADDGFAHGLTRNAFALRAVAAAKVAGGELGARVRHFSERGGVKVALHRSGSRDDSDEEEAAEGLVGRGRGAGASAGVSGAHGRYRRTRRYVVLSWLVEEIQKSKEALP